MHFKYKKKKREKFKKQFEMCIFKLVNILSSFRKWKATLLSTQTKIFYKS